MKTTFLAWTVLILICTGCANISTIDRSTALPGNGKAIHLDSPQRLAFSDGSGHICAEPTPDALQAYASAIGGGVGVPTQRAVSVAQALQTSAGSIGLHTQSITLMRDALYRICEASHNKDLAPGDVIQLLERSQDLTLGVLAIEQLTGAVVARQVILSGGANAAASSNIANTQAALDSVKKTEEMRKKTFEDAQANQKKQTELVAQTETDLQAENAKTTPDQTVVTRLRAQLEAQKADLGKANDAVTAAREDYSKAQLATQAVLNNFNAAITSANAAASGTGHFSTEADRGTIDKDTVGQIAEATKYIVATIVQKGHLTDTCIALMTRYASENNRERKQALQPIFEQCKSVIDAYIQVYLASQKVVGSQTPVLAPVPAQLTPPPPPSPPPLK